MEFYRLHHRKPSKHCIARVGTKKFYSECIIWHLTAFNDDVFTQFKTHFEINANLKFQFLSLIYFIVSSRVGSDRVVTVWWFTLCNLNWCHYHFCLLKNYIICLAFICLYVLGNFCVCVFFVINWTMILKIHTNYLICRYISVRNGDRCSQSNLLSFHLQHFIRHHRIINVYIGHSSRINGFRYNRWSFEPDK